MFNDKVAARFRQIRLNFFVLFFSDSHTRIIPYSQRLHKKNFKLQQHALVATPKRGRFGRRVSFVDAEPDAFAVEPFDVATTRKIANEPNQASATVFQRDSKSRLPRRL